MRHILLAVCTAILVSGAELSAKSHVTAPAVKIGATVLAERGYDILKRQKFGVITNPTGVFPDLSHIADVLHAQPGVREQFVGVFGPEHGFRGDQQAGYGGGSYVDFRTGLQVWSIYGVRGKALEALFQKSHAEVIVFDIQDVGSRFYTYIWSMWDAMVACSNLNLTMVVLDRPNPLGGLQVNGPILNERFRSGVGRLPIAMQHGMTVGELAVMFAEHYLPLLPPTDSTGKVHLTVIPMEGWKRSMLFGVTGQPFVMPSPNMPTADTATVYPGFGLIEGTSASTGRGTTRPFEIVGAPWLINATQSLATVLNALSIPGVRFREVYYVPTFDRFTGEVCAGTELHITDIGVYDPVLTAIQWIIHARALAVPPTAFKWSQNNWIDLLSGTEALRTGVDRGLSASAVMTQWATDVQQWRAIRERFLRYPVF